MRKLSLIAALIVGASFAYGDVIYWMVGSDYAEEAKTLGDQNAATLYYVYSGTATPLDYLTGADVADFYPASVETDLGSYKGDGYSYYVELWNGSRTAEMSYADAKSNGYISSGGGMFTPTPASQTGFGGGSSTYNVPEPTSGLLFIVGGMLLGLKRRRQV